MVGWVVSGCVFALALWLLVRASKYSRIFSDEHFSEIARSAAILKAAALERVDEPNQGSAFSPADPRAFITKANLLILYTMRRGEGHVLHHLSVSVLGEFTARAVGTTFLAWVAMLVGLPVDRLVLEVGRTTVHHGEAKLTEEEHDRIAKAPVLDVPPDKVGELRRACLEARARLKEHPGGPGTGRGVPTL